LHVKGTAVTSLFAMRLATVIASDILLAAIDACAKQTARAVEGCESIEAVWSKCGLSAGVDEIEILRWICMLLTTGALHAAILK